MKANISIFASGNIVASLPDGKIITGHNTREVAEKLRAQGATGVLFKKNWEYAFTEPVEFENKDGSLLFTDRGNRVTFDRVCVSDDEIRSALAHAQQQFGTPLTLTGSDPIFTERMARIAGEMGIAINK